MNKQTHPMFSATTSKFIQEICRPLKHKGLTNFMHDITYGHGEISMLMNDENVFQYYYQNKIPMLCTDESGRTLSNGIYLNKTLESTHQECAILMPLLQKVGKQFGQNFGRQSIHIVVREENCQHLYSLFFDLQEHEFLHWVVNNGKYLEDVLANYNRNAKDLILEAQAKENRIVLPNFSDLGFTIKPNLTKTDRFTLWHKELMMPIHLSAQQSRCLTLLLQGKSAKEIALEMNLSYRTVEHYFEKIRKMLGCSSNKELIANYSDQLR